MTIGEKIKFLRQKKGLTQKQLGDLCGMADSAIRRYESGRANPKIETLEKIAIALDISIDDLSIQKKGILDKFIDILKLDYYDDEILDDLQKEAFKNKNTKMQNLMLELNHLGQDKAIEQVELLTKIPEYQRKYIEETATILNAAHERTDIETTEEMKKHDDDIMNDENF